MIENLRSNFMLGFSAGQIGLFALGFLALVYKKLFILKLFLFLTSIILGTG